jgi:hypothetical protein
MSRQLSLIVIFNLLISLSASAGTKAYSILLELHSQEKNMFQSLDSEQLSNSQKLEAILQQKQNTEMTLQKLIVEAESDPAAQMTKATSPLSIAFKVGDLINVLAQLELDPSENFTQDSCDQSRAQLYITAKENRGIAPLERLQTKILGLLVKFCGNK